MSLFVRPGLERISAYSAAPLPGVDLDLRDNINLWGAPPRAVAAVRAAAECRLQSYPAVDGGALVDELASRLGVRESEVVAGCGSDDLIDACFRAAASPGDRVAHSDPTFSMVPIFARLNGLEPVAVAPRADGSADVDALLATGARIIYLCSPNNPTGAPTPESEIRRLITYAPGVVLVDEAYAEFSGATDWRAEVPAMERVVVTRTFSKAWGLAGLRVGYGVGGKAIVAAVAKVRGPYKLGALGALAARTALREDGAWMQAAAADARSVRDRFTAELGGRRAVRALESRGNFVFLQVDERASAVAARFAALGIGVRAFDDLPVYGSALRIGVAPWESFRRVLDAAREIWP